MMMLKNPVLLMLIVTVLAPIVLYTDKLGSFNKAWSSMNESMMFGSDARQPNLLPLEPLTSSEQPTRSIYANMDAAMGDIVTNVSNSEQDAIEHMSRALYATGIGDQSKRANPIRQGWSGLHEKVDNVVLHNLQTDENIGEKSNGITVGTRQDAKSDWEASQRTIKADTRATIMTRVEKQNEQANFADARVRHLKDQLIRAKVYLSLVATRNNPHYIRELRLRMKETQRALGDATSDSALPRNAHEKIKAMDQTLAKGKQIHDDCSAVVKKLRAILHSTEEQLRVHKKQTTFLTQLTAKTLPKGLHCLPLCLSTQYYALNSDKQHLPNQHKLEDLKLFHYALFSDNILATSVVVNSTVFHAKEPWNHVFHIVTDRLNYAAMKMWFIANPPGNATIEIQNVEEFMWLNSSYSPVLKQLASQSMIDYYFKVHHANSDSNLKFRNPKYLSVLNHLRFYLPDIFPKLEKMLFLDDDIVVQNDLSSLWSLDLKQNVNGAVETCGDSFHRFERYLNFSNPIISETFNPHACGWAYGMNIFDLNEWKKQNVTQVYHNWQKLNHNQQLWKLGTLPPGLITFYNCTFPLDRSWHVLGLGYNPDISENEIKHAAVIHYNGNMKPWLEISIPIYRTYWAKFINHDNVYLRECNINP